MMFWKTFRSAILAGICISCGGAVYLNVGGVAGACLFSFGLLAIVHYRLKLYTGTAGFIDLRSPRQWADMGVVLLGNIAGCFLMGLLAHYAMPSCVDAAQKIVEVRLGKGILRCAALGIGCGFVMTTVVTFAREGKFLPLLFGIPLFILCGFTHCIADAFYYFAAPWQSLANPSLLWIYLGTIAGNFVGCNLTRSVIPDLL